MKKSLVFLSLLLVVVLFVSFTPASVLYAYGLIGDGLEYLTASIMKTK
ncbi:MAG TPA: hypothetical protein PKU80_12395 [Candidatus Limiplasma sp.]|nr:hypothetical protein [Candidatus Limiplasma sp.]